MVYVHCQGSALSSRSQNQGPGWRDTSSWRAQPKVLSSLILRISPLPTTRALLCSLYRHFTFHRQHFPACGSQNLNHLCVFNLSTKFSLFIMQKAKAEGWGGVWLKAGAVETTLLCRVNCQLGVPISDTCTPHTTWVWKGVCTGERGDHVNRHTCVSI